MTSLTRELVLATRNIEKASIGPDALAAVRRLLLDHIAVAANGSTTASAAALRQSHRWFAAEGGAALPVIGPGTLAPAVRASMANAVAAHATEYDDVHNASSSHPGVVIYPAVFAAAAIGGATEDAVVRGVAVGYEVMCRIGRAANPPSHYARHFHPTGTVGALGAAAAAAAVLDLDLDKTVSAIGIAGSMAAGSMEFLVDGAWTKRLHPAFACRSGVEAALLAAEGFVGPLDIVGGARGFLAAYSEDARPGELLAEWGHRPLEIEVTSIKAHTCCRYNQGGIDAVLALRSEHGLAPADIARVTIGIPTVAVDIVVEPAASKRAPETVVDAQFSLPYGVAVALRHGHAGTEEYAEAAIADEETAALMNRVGYRVDAAIDAVYPEKWGAWAEIETLSGTILRAEVDDPKGDPANPLTDDEMLSKFTSLTDAILPESSQEAVIDAALHFGDAGTFARLNDALSGGSGGQSSI